MSSSSICCTTHSAEASNPSETIQKLSKMYPHGAQLVTGGQPVAWGGKISSFSMFAPTQALDALAAQRPIPVKSADGTPVAPTVLKVSTLKLCKQHSAGGDCKLGAKCRNIHLCPEMFPGGNSTTTSSSRPQLQRAESANRQGGLKLPPIPGALQHGSSSIMTRGASPVVVALPIVNTTTAATGIVAAPERSCNSPMKSAARSARLAGVDASKMKPVPPPPRTSESGIADLDDIVLVSTPVPTPPPRAPSAGVSTGSGCFRRFVKRWNEPLKAGSSGAAAVSLENSRVVSSAGNSIDLEAVRCNVQTLEIAAAADDEKEEAASGCTEEVQPLPPTNASGEGRCYARRSAFENHEGFFAVFSS